MNAPRTLIQQTKTPLYHASNASNSSRYMYYLILFLTVFLPFEDFILKPLPGPDEVYFAARFLSELLIYGGFAWVVLHKLLHRARFLHTPIDSAILIFACTTGLSLIYFTHDLSQIFTGVINLRPMFRYILFFYLVINTPLSPVQVNRVLTLVMVAGLLMMLSGLMQFIAGGALDSFFTPRETGIEIAGEERHSRIASGSREFGAINGAASDTIFFAFTLNILVIVCLAKFRTGRALFSGWFGNSGIPSRYAVTTRRIALLAIFPVILMMDVLSYVRASQVAILMIVALEAYYWFGHRFTLAITGILSVLVIFVFIIFPPYWNPGGATKTDVDPLADLTSAFSAEYIVNNLENQRLHQLVSITPTILLNSPLIGYGPDEELVLVAINDAPTRFMNRPIERKEFQDVYWVAILAKYGLMGLLAFVYIFYRLFSSAHQIYHHTKHATQKELSLAVMYMILISIPILFLERAFEYRIFGYYFWLFPALMFSLNSFLTNVKLTEQRNKEIT